MERGSRGFYHFWSDRLRATLRDEITVGQAAASHSFCVEGDRDRPKFRSGIYRERSSDQFCIDTIHSYLT